MLYLQAIQRVMRVHFNSEWESYFQNLGGSCSGWLTIWQFNPKMTLSPLKPSLLCSDSCLFTWYKRSIMRVTKSDSVWPTGVRVRWCNFYIWLAGRTQLNQPSWRQSLCLCPHVRAASEDDRRCMKRLAAPSVFLLLLLWVTRSFYWSNTNNVTTGAPPHHPPPLQ